MVAHGYEDNALRVRRRCGDLYDLSPAGPEPACQECCNQQRGHESSECPFPSRSPERRCRGRFFRQAIAYVEPHFLFKEGAGLRNFSRRHAAEQGLKPLIVGAAGRTLCQMLTNLHFVVGVAVVVQYDLFFAEMCHFEGLANGSSCCRSFCTARNTLFLAALVFRFNVLLISSMDRPSMCRMVNATRSAGVSRES